MESIVLCMAAAITPLPPAAPHSNRASVTFYQPPLPQAPYDCSLKHPLSLYPTTITWLDVLMNLVPLIIGQGTLCFYVSPIIMAVLLTLNYVCFTLPPGKKCPYFPISVFKIYPTM